jgi:hypothetical protein
MAKRPTAVAPLPKSGFSVHNHAKGALVRPEVIFMRLLDPFYIL